MKGLYNVVLFILLSFCFSVLIAQTTLDEIVNDMILPHEGRPHGVPSSADWSYKPRIGAVEPPADWNAAIAWGQLYEWSAGNPATNTRVQIKDLELYYLSKIDHKWHLLQKSARVGGANYVEDFHDDLNKPADIKYPVDGGVSVTCGGGYNFHFWPTSGRIKFPANEVAGCFVTVKARLILANPSGNDDRDSAKFVMSVGGDWWLSLTAAWDQWKTNADMGIGRFRFVTPEWKSFNMYSVPKDTIIQNPPPYLSISTPVEINPGIPSFTLFQNYPNPFKNSTQIGFYLTDPDYTRLSVYTITGKLEAVLFEKNAVPGIYNVQWNTDFIGPGIYIMKLESSSKSVSLTCQVL